MKRLQYERRFRTVPGHARNSAEAVMYLAHVARERHRLGQERSSLEKRMKRIEARLSAIAATETKLVPMIRLEHSPVLPAPAPPPRHAAPIDGGLTLHY